MIKNIISLLVITCFFVSCSSYKEIMYADNNIKKVSIGMSKDQVIKIMGKSYEIIGAKGNSITLGYKSVDDGIYKLYFESEKLKGWNKEWLYPHYHKNGSKDTSFDTSTNIHLKAHRNAMLLNASSDAEKAHINAHMDAHERAMTGTVSIP